LLKNKRKGCELTYKYICAIIDIIKTMSPDRHPLGSKRKEVELAFFKINGHYIEKGDMVTIYHHRNCSGVSGKVIKILKDEVYIDCTTCNGPAILNPIETMQNVKK
jgi:hypothetical protein